MKPLISITFKPAIFIAVIACAVVVAVAASATPKGERVTKVMQQPFTSPSQPVFDMLTIDLAPDATVPAHKHPGPVFAYVMDGELVTRIGNGPEEVLNRARRITSQPE